jgi:N12 class adenine-specific DNA methylase
MVGNYNVSGNRGYFSTVAATEEWGAGGKNFLDLFEDVLNGKQTTITYRDSEGKTHVDDDATRLARAKQDEIKLRWYDWVYEDTARAKGLADTYNREINNLAPRAFDGSQMTFPGKNPLMEPRPHQANAAMRIVQTPTQLLHHSVGTGKSGSMAMGTMELRRTGIRQKILHVVPKTTLAGYATAFRNWYPGAKILVAEEANFNPAMRDHHEPGAVCIPAHVARRGRGVLRRADSGSHRLHAGSAKAGRLPLLHRQATPAYHQEPRGPAGQDSRGR